MTDLYTILDSRATGLTTAEAEERQKRDGLNKLPEAKRRNFLIIFIKQFADPLIYILLLAAAISIFLKELSDGIFILVTLAINALVGAYQEFSAEKSAAALKNMVKSIALVQRNGEFLEIEAEELVRGDVVILKDGAVVPADIVLVESDDLQVNESMLTGESLAVKKIVADEIKTDVAIQDKNNEVFAGTIITKGVARGIVKATGLQTEIGKIADKITQKSEAKPPLMMRMEKFSFALTMIMGVAIVIIATVALLKGMGLQETFMMAVSLAVAAIPEGLPIAITLTLAVGMLKMSKRNVLVRNLVAVESLGSCTTIASDKTGTLTLNELTVQKVVMADGKDFSFEGGDFMASPEGQLILGCVLPNEASITDGKFLGDAVDVAFLKFALPYDIESMDDKYPRLKLLYYSSNARCSASFHEINGQVVAFVKGAPETLLAMSKVKDYSKIQQQLDEMTANGLRVLAVAAGIVEKREEYGYEDLKNLDFLGLVAMIDPLRPEVLLALEECKNAGVRVNMITGDNPKTAYAIAKELKFVESVEEVVTGLDVKKAIDEGRLDELTSSTRVYARMEPTQKLDIVSSLIRNGQLVAVTGDGVNDAPALKNANVGVAMGKNGTDIARESADIILTDDNFASITHAVEEGRIAYANIRKVIFFAVSTGITEVAVFVLSLLLGLPIPFTAVQLLWLNVVTEGAQTIFLAYEKAEGNEMNRPPRDPEEPIFNKLMVQRMAVAIASMSLLFVATYYYLLKVAKVDSTFCISILMTMMVIFQNMQVLNSRSETLSIFKHSFKGNWKLFAGMVGAMTVHIIAAETPFVDDILGLVPLSLKSILLIFAVSTILILTSEVDKYIRTKKMK